MNELPRRFFEAETAAFGFLEREYGYNRVAEFFDNERDFREGTYIVRYMGKGIAVDVCWYDPNAIINVEFTELSHGEFPESRVFSGKHSGKSRATDLYTVVAIRRGHVRDFLLGDFSGLTYSKIKKREQIISSGLPLVLQNMRELCITYASDILEGDLSIFPAAMKYQQDMIDKRSPTR